MSETTILILTAIISAGLGALINGYFKRAEVSANTNLLSANAIATLLNQISDLAASRDADRQKIETLEQRIDDMDDAAEIKDKYVEKLETENKEIVRKFETLRLFVKRLIVELDKQSIKYPPPPDNLLDTQELKPYGK